MRKTLAPVAALALFGTLGMASAEEAKGPITKIDVPADAIQVGTIYLKLEGTKIEGLKVGDQVEIEYYVGDDGPHLQTIKKI